MKYQNILRQMATAPWAILPEKLAVIRDLLAYRASGHTLTDAEIEDRLAAESQRPVYGASGHGEIGGSYISVLPLVGTIIPRGNMFAESSGAVSMQRFATKFQAALNDPEVSHIVFDVDSPGGQVGGVAEMAAEIYNARGTKPIIAVSNGLAASAAYWLATAADELVVTPSGEVGSIGVFAAHQDISGYLEKEGVAINLISAGKYKVEGNPYEPLTDESREAIQSRIDGYYGMFTGDVARHRGVSIEAVQSGFGEGRVVGADDAVALGMADRVATFDEVVNGLLAKRAEGQSARADLDRRRRRLRALSR